MTSHTAEMSFQTATDLMSADVPMKRLGQLLLQDGKLTEDDIQRVIGEQLSGNRRFGDAAIRLGLISEPDLQRALSSQFDYSYVNAGDSALSPSLFSAHRPFGVQAEALRALRTQLSLRWFQDQRRVLTVAAPREATGASLIAANLAIAFAQAGQRTLAIDADLRTPSQHALFGLSGSPGLSDALVGRCTLEEVRQRATPFETLYFIGSGSLPPNPQELLGREEFVQLLAGARRSFDVVIVNTAPLLKFADAQVVAALTGACLLAVRRHETKLADIHRAAEQLEPTGTVLLGATLYE